MSLTAFFKVGSSEERGLLRFSYSFSQAINEKGKPSAEVQVGRFEASFYSNGQNDKDLVEWMLSSIKK